MIKTIRELFSRKMVVNTTKSQYLDYVIRYTKTIWITLPEVEKATELIKWSTPWLRVIDFASLTNIFPDDIVIFDTDHIWIASIWSNLEYIYLVEWYWIGNRITQYTTKDSIVWNVIWIIRKI
jgi:hypothetical protein